MARKKRRSQDVRLSRLKTIRVQVQIMPHEDVGRFVACASFKTKGHDAGPGRDGYHPPKLRGACHIGTAPRRAAAGALRLAAKQIGSRVRRGAFAGLGSPKGGTIRTRGNRRRPSRR